LIERPYIPQEVERLAEPGRKIMDGTEMTNAILVGSNSRRAGGLEEVNLNNNYKKPSMYSTIINRHSTSVIHPVPQPVNYAVNPATTSAFENSQTESAQLTPGAYSIPVKLQGGAVQDPTMSEYETPNFIHTGEKITPVGNIHEAPKFQLSPETNMQKVVQQDIKDFISQFDNAKDKADRIKVLLEGKNRLSEESKSLALQVENEVKELLDAKEVAVRLFKLLGNYENKLKKNVLSNLKLADEITVKNILRDKLHREIQGFRTSPGEYLELEMINPADVTQVIQTIKNKLGLY
jgi:hypothetical protein